MNPAEIVKQGTWLYAGTHKSGIRVFRDHTIRGTHDYEDPPEIRDDREVECFRVDFESPPGSSIFEPNRKFLSLAEAVDHVEQLLGNSVRWDDENR